MNPTTQQQNQARNQQSSTQMVNAGVKFVAKQIIGRVGTSVLLPLLAILIVIFVFTFIIVLTGAGTAATVRVPGSSTTPTPPVIVVQPTITPQTTPTPTPTTPPGQPTPTQTVAVPTTTSAQNPVLRYVAAIGRLCGTVVSTSNNLYACISSLQSEQPPFNRIAIERLKTSATTFGGNLQCVDFVQAMQIEQNFTQLLKGGVPLGSAIEHAGPNNIDGYDYIKNEPGAIMRVGDIAIWQGGTFGHMGYVTQVFPAGRDFEVAEANWRTLGDVQTRADTREIADACKKDVNCRWVVGWLRRK